MAIEVEMSIFGFQTSRFSARCPVVMLKVRREFVDFGSAKIHRHINRYLSSVSLLLNIKRLLYSWNLPLLVDQECILDLAISILFFLDLYLSKIRFYRGGKVKVRTKRNHHHLLLMIYPRLRRISFCTSLLRSQQLSDQCATPHTGFIYV